MAEKLNDNLADKNALGHHETEVGDFGSDAIGTDDLKAKTRALEINDTIARAQHHADLQIQQPLSRVISNPDSFVNHRIKLSGFFCYSPENHALYLTHDDAAHLSRSKSIWIEFRSGTKTSENLVTRAKTLNGKYVVIEGTFDPLLCGFNNVHSGGLRDCDYVTELNDTSYRR